MINGIDVSEFQGTIDWKKVKKAGVKFAIIRAGFGNSISQKDEYFDRNMKGALDAGVAVGAYWFSYAVSAADARREADVFKEVLRPYRGRAAYPVFFDWEYASYDYAVKQGVTPTRRLITDMAKAFIDRMRDDGWYAGYYTNHDYYNNRYYPEELKKYKLLWLASYGGTPSISCELQQNSSTGRVDGIYGNVDTDISYVDFPALVKKEGWNGFPKDGGSGGGDDDNGGDDGGNTCTVTGVGVRLRKEAQTEAEVLAVPPKGAVVTWIADDEWGWSYLKYGKLKGWMSNYYLSRKGLSGYRIGTNHGVAVNVRREPSLSGAVLDQIYPGKTFRVVCILPSNWLHIEIDNREAYLYFDRSYISIGGRVSR